MNLGLYIGTLEWRTPCYFNSYIYVVRRSAQVANFTTVASFIKHCQVPLTSFVLSRKSFGRVFTILSQSRDHKAPKTSRFQDLSTNLLLFLFFILNVYIVHVNKRVKAYSQLDDYSVMSTVSQGSPVAMKRRGVYCANVASPSFQSV